MGFCKKIFSSRAFPFGLLILFQLLLLFFAVWFLSDRLQLLYPILYGAGLVIALLIATREDHSSYKLAWVFLILLFPLFGGVLYLLFGLPNRDKAARRRVLRLNRELAPLASFGQADLAALKGTETDAWRESYYIQSISAFPVYQRTAAQYLTPGEESFSAMLCALEAAERFIFLEYFIICDGQMWQKILAILEKKARAGIDVRVLYDDAGCMDLLPKNYHETLGSKGIRCRVFNRLHPLLVPQMNHRDHRKLLIVDGVVGFTGGINIGDEYINVKKIHGHWKDAALMLRGEAVASMTAMFFQLWYYPKDRTEPFETYLPDAKTAETFENDGFVQPFGDIPLDRETVGLNAYLNMIGRAKDYIYIQTPYLILDGGLATALTLAAKSGVDVRIMTPRVGDKWYVHTTTRANYAPLLRAGVRIYEYAPGFIHSKAAVCDDRTAIVGSINFDYRSFFLHFECAVWMHRCRAVAAVREDFLNTQKRCVEILPENIENLPRHQKMLMGLLRLFSFFM